MPTARNIEATRRCEAQKPDIAAKRRTQHIVRIDFGLYGLDEAFVESIDLVFWQIDQKLLFVAKRERRFTGKARAKCHAKRFVTRQFRPWADQAHVAFQNVPELGQLVELETPEERSDARDAIVAGYGMGGG